MTKSVCKEYFNLKAQFNKIIKEDLTRNHNKNIYKNTLHHISMIELNYKKGREKAFHKDLFNYILDSF